MMGPGTPGRACGARRAALATIGAVWLIAAIGGAIVGTFESFGPPPLGRDLEVSTLVLDRNGKLLRAYLTSEGRWRLPATREQVDPIFLEALLAYEDKRFFSHPGVDPLAVMRAAYQFVTHGRIVSGGSTITMQVARLLEPRRHRSLDAKIRQTVRALELEWALSKDEILGLYLTLAPYGGNLEGIRAASLAYFGKEPRRLTLGEAALLVALPQSPEFRRPDRFPEKAKLARDRVLDRIAGKGLFSDAEIAHAKQEDVPTARKKMPLIAPHAADQALAQTPKERVVRLTIDGGLQRSLEKLARERAEALGADMSVAIVVVDNATGEVLARVASPDYFDVRRAGAVDLTQAVRSPGSALKPFIYGLGFEDGLIHPESLIEDRPIRYAGYAPENFDLTFQGTVTVRRALQLSLNVPAVAVLDAVGPSRLVARLAQAGAPLELQKSEAPGLALGLGGVGVRLTDLTMLYAGLARQGTVAPLIERLGAPPLPPRRLIEPVAAWYVGNVLLGTPPPRERGGRAHRLQDRHELRLPRRLGGRLRRQAHDRGVDRAAGRRPGRGAGRAHQRGADPVRCLRADGPGLSTVAGGAERRDRRLDRQAAAAATALRAGRERRRGHGAQGAYRVSAKRREPRTGRHRRREARPDRHQDRGRHPSPQRAAERHAARRQENRAHAVFRA